MPEKIKTAIVGLGAWGRNVARELAGASDLVAYASREPARHHAWTADHAPGAEAMTVAQIAADPSITAVAIATPIPTLTGIARQMIEAGKHVLVEKPMALTSADAQELADTAALRGLVAAAGYVFLYHPVYRELKRRVDAASVRRIALAWDKFGTFDDAIVHSLLVHHLSLALDLLGQPTGGTLARGPGVKSACDKIEAKLSYPRAEVVSVIDRVAARPAHTMMVESSDGASLIWDGDALFAVRDGARGEIFRAKPQSALAAEVAAFVAAAAGGAPPLPSAGDFAARVLRVLEGLR
jgi:predicted dehydrogenase